MAMKASQFISGGGAKSSGLVFASAATFLGVVLRGGRIVQQLRNPRILAGMVSVEDALGKFAKEDGNRAQRILNKAKKVVGAPGRFFEQSPEEILTKEPEAKWLGEGGKKAVKKVQKGTQNVGDALIDGLGSVFEKLEEKFNFSTKVSVKVEKRREDLDKVSQNLSTVNNKLTLVDRVKGIFSKKKPLASNEELSELFTESGVQRLEEAQRKQNEFDALTVKQRNQIKKRAQELEKQFKTEFAQKTELILETAEEGTKPEAPDIKIAYKEYKESLPEEDKKVVEYATVLGSGKKEYYTDNEKKKLKSDLEEKGKIGSSVKNEVDKYTANRSEVERLEKKKRFWENPKEAIREGTKKITAGDVVDYGVRYAAVTQQGISKARKSSRNARALKVLIADLEGGNPKDISTGRIVRITIGAFVDGVLNKIGIGGIFVTNKNPMVAEAAKQYARATFVDYFIFSVGAVGQEVAAQKIRRRYGSNSVPGMLVPAAFMAIQNFGGFARARANQVQPQKDDQNPMAGANPMANMMNIRRQTLLEVYIGLLDKQDEGKPLDANDYMDILTTASKEIRDIGGVRSYDTRLIATYYAEKQLSISDVMKDLNVGKSRLMERSHQGREVTAEYARKKQEELKDQNLQEEPQKKFTEDERNQPKSKKGSFTEGLKNEANHEVQHAEYAGMGA